MGHSSRGRLTALLAAAVTLCLAFGARAEPVTFAQFTERDARANFNFVRNTNNASAKSGLFNTVDTHAGDDVYFDYLSIAGLPAGLDGPQLAHVTVNSGAGLRTTANATAAGGIVAQPFDQPLTLTFARDTPILQHGVSLSDLLTVTISPTSLDTFLDGKTAGNTASLNADTANYLVSFTSDFLKFDRSSNRGAALSLSGVVSTTPRCQGFSVLSKFVCSFTADTTGTFDSDPPPVAIPEPGSLLLLASALIGLAAIRRLGAAA